MNYDLEGKVVIITGAARGVGRAMVGMFVEQGTKVVAADRDAEGLAQTCAPFPGVISLVEDISTPEGAEKIVGTALNHFGHLDICVNNAAVAPHTALLEEKMEVWDRVYAVNCRGTYLDDPGGRQSHDRWPGAAGGSLTSRPGPACGEDLVQRHTPPAVLRPRASPGLRPLSWLPITSWSTRLARD